MIVINTIKLINGDCLDKLKQIKDKSVNLVLIDPPYNISKADWDTWKTVDEYIEFMGQVFIESQRVLKDNGSFYFFHNDFEQLAELQHWIKKNTRFVFKSLVTIDKLDNNYIKDLYGSQEHFRNYLNLTEYVCFYTFEDRTGLNQILTDKELFKSIKDYLQQEREKAGLKTMKQINEVLGTSTNGGGKASNIFGKKETTKAWEFPTENLYTRLQTTGYFQKTWIELKQEYDSLREQYEGLRQNYEKDRYVFNASDGLKNCWSYSFREDKKLKHPTQKPVQLIKDIITYSSNEGDTILDCFMGSATCAEACLHTNRNFIGIELDNGYFETCKNRVNTYIKENNLQDIHIEIA